MPFSVLHIYLLSIPLRQPENKIKKHKNLVIITFPMRYDLKKVKDFFKNILSPNNEISL